jgi:hypothetical protein
MADMKMKEKTINISESAIDEIVIAQADNPTAWGKPIKVRRSKAATLTLSEDLAARATFFTRLHHEESVEDWLKRVIQERIDLEEAAFADVKRDLAYKTAMK